MVPTNPHLTSHPSGDPGTSRPLCRKCLEGLGAGRGPEDPGRGLLAGGRVQGEWLEFACFSPGNRGGAACRCVSWRHAHQDPLGTRGAVQGWGSPTGLRPMVLDTRGGLRAPRRARPHACSTHSTQASMDMELLWGPDGVSPGPATTYRITQYANLLAAQGSLATAMTPHTPPLQLPSPKDPATHQSPKNPAFRPCSSQMALFPQCGEL